MKSKSSTKREVRQIRETAKKVAATRASARRFLVSIGVYSRGGKLRAGYR